MRDPLLDLAQSLPSCRMLLRPNGWLSALRPGVVWPPGGGTGSRWEEKAGLVTLTNATNDGRAFYATNQTLAARVVTTVDMRGWAAATIIAKGRINTAISSDSMGICAGQGENYNLSSFRPAVTTSRKIVFSGRFGASNAPLNVVSNLSIPAEADIPVVLVARLDAGNLQVLVNGATVINQATDGAVGNFAAAGNESARLYILPYATPAPYARLFEFAIFNEALTADQIAYGSK